jgi:Tfp pilus assembly protein PilO
MGDFKVQKAVVLAVLALLLVGDGVLAYYNSEIAAKAQDPELALKAQTKQLEDMKSEVDRASKIKARMPEVEKYFDQFETTLPPQGKGYSMLSQEFDEIAHETHVQVVDKKYHQKEVSGRNLDEVEIEATLEGDYTGIVRFLNRVQRSKNTYVVDSLGLDSQKGTGPGNQAPTGSVKVDLKVRSYFRKV